MADKQPDQIFGLKAGTATHIGNSQGSALNAEVLPSSCVQSAVLNGGWPKVSLIFDISKPSTHYKFGFEAGNEGARPLAID
jgi:hypothetical protein